MTKTSVRVAKALSVGALSMVLIAIGLLFLGADVVGFDAFNVMVAGALVNAIMAYRNGRPPGSML